MEIEIKRDIFEGDDFKGVNTLIQNCTYKGRHDLVIDIPSVKGTDLFDRLDLDDRQLLDQNFNSYMLSLDSSKKVTKQSLGCTYSVTNNSKNEREFNLDEANFFFTQKLSILLENSLNDSYFIEALFNFFDPSGKLKQSYENDWIVFDNAGGCGNYINYINGNARSLRKFFKPPGAYFRFFVLLDCDRLSRSAPLNTNHTALENYLIANSIKYHITEKRNMENYLPCEAFEEFDSVSTNSWIEAYKYLSPEQKDFININKGFTKKDGKGRPKCSREELPAEVKVLYANVSDENFNNIDRGLQIRDFKINFPKKFVDSHYVYKQTLLKRTEHQVNKDELKEITDKILSLL